MNIKLSFLKSFSLAFIFISFFTSATNNPLKEKPLPLIDYFTQTWTTHDGLPHNGINALSQSSDGYLWVGTWEGLARFNGNEFKNFSRGSIIGLPDSAIKSLTSLSSGELLVAGARGGVSERINRQWLPQKSAQTMVNHAIYDNQQGIWLALEGKGVVFRDTTKQKDTTIIHGLRVYRLAQDTNNTVWAATNKGLYSIKNKTIISHINSKYGLPNTPVYSVLFTKNNKLIVGTELGAFVLKQDVFQPLHHKLSQEVITSLLEDTQGSLWLGTSNHGIFRLYDGQVENLTDQDGLPNNRVSSLLQDNEGSIWIGTSSGLIRLNEAPFITLTKKQGLSGNYIRSVLSHSDGSIWIGSSKGLDKVVGRNIINIKSTFDNTPLSVLSLAETEQGDVLVGTYTTGVFKVDNNKLLPFLNTAQGLPSNEVRSILYDSKHNTWIGTATGLVKISPNGKKSYFNKQTGLPDNFIMALAEDKQGKIWIGTGIGIATYYDDIIQAYSLNDKFNAEYAFGFYIEKNSIWLATDRGIIHIDELTNKMQAITKENGLPVDKLFQIVIDKADNFWLTSNRGVIKITRQQINQVLLGKSKTLIFKMFAEDVGLLSSQANGGSMPAASLDKENNVWIATAKGASQVSLQRLRRASNKQLPLIIEQFIADGVHYPLQKNTEILLPKGTTRIAIHYAGLGFLMSNHIQYQTLLVGFDNVWQNKFSQRTSEFTNLSPGKYTFKMRAMYSNSTWSEQFVQVDFSIPPFYWQTLWFKLSVIFMILIGLYFIYLYRVSTIKHSEDRLKQLIEKQTKDLKQQADLFAYQATHDQLTSLSNRRAFDKWCDTDFQETKKKGGDLSLAIIDIDHFKRVNDQHSHLVGDKVIKIVANILLDLSSKHRLQIKPARWGGEEFTLLIFGSESESFECCEHIRKTVENYDLSSIAHGLNITISIGVTNNSLVNEYDKMINNADLALYYAKHHGRNQVKLYQQDDTFYIQDRRK